MPATVETVNAIVTSPDQRSGEGAPAAANLRQGATVHVEASPSGDDTVDEVRSSYAGAMYFVNLALYLELFGDFTQPRAQQCRVSLGELLAQIAGRACGRSLQDDPVWRVFLALGAETERDGNPFVKDAERYRDALWPRLIDAAVAALRMPDDLVLRFLCEQSGRIEIRPTRIDAFFALAEHPIEIRITGLDRNPGWVPAAGRILAFHYE